MKPLAYWRLACFCSVLALIVATFGAVWLAAEGRLLEAGWLGLLVVLGVAETMREAARRLG